MTKTKTWEEIRSKKFTAEELREIDRGVAREALAISLRAVRELSGVTQVDAADRSGISQGELSRMERRDDSLVSTLRRYIEALGGEFEMRAVFGDRSVRISMGDDLSRKPFERVVSFGSSRDEGITVRARTKRSGPKGGKKSKSRPETRAR